MKIFFRTTHFPGGPSTRIGKRKKVKQSIIDPPRQRDNLMIRIRFLKEMSGTSVESDHSRDCFACGQVAAKVSKHGPGDVFSFDRVLGRRDSIFLNVELRGQRFSRIMK